MDSRCGPIRPSWIVTCGCWPESPRGFAPTKPSLLKLTPQRARLLAKVPVSTAEYAQTWLDHPDLADAVDFLTVHLLPYWQIETDPVGRPQRLILPDTAKCGCAMTRTGMCWRSGRRVAKNTNSPGICVIACASTARRP
jgi:hypothetical protein